MTVPIRTAWVISRTQHTVESTSYPTVEELLAFIFQSSMKGLRDSTVRNTVLHEVNSR